MLGSTVLAAIVAAAGGLASPAALAIAALPFEAWWLRRTPSFALSGATAALAIIPLQAIFGTVSFTNATAASAGHWLIPLAYLAFVIPRVAAWVEEVTSGARAAPGIALDQIIEGVVVRMADTGDVSDASRQARKMAWA